MDVLVQKPKGSIKIWTLIGIIAVLVFYVCYTSIDLYYFQASSGQVGALDYINLFISALNGIFLTTILVFFIGLYVSKKKAFFLKFILWAMLLAGLYIGMPSIANLGQLFTAYSGLDLMYYIGLVLPSLLSCALLVSVLVQKDSENTSVTNMISWICIVVDVLLFVFQLVYVFNHAENLGSFETVIESLTGAVSIVVYTSLAFVFLNATKAAAKIGTEKEAALDNLVEKIAKGPQKEESNLEEMVEKISHED